eukprot:UN02305
MYTTEKLQDIVYKLLLQGIHVATHCIGDYATHQILNAYNTALELYTNTTHFAHNSRLRMEHFQTINTTHTAIGWKLWRKWGVKLHRCNQSMQLMTVLLSHHA